MADRIIRSKEERLAEVEKKIASHKRAIEALEKRKNTILNPKRRTRKASFNSVIAKAKESGISVEELAEKLGITIE